MKFQIGQKVRCISGYHSECGSLRLDRGNHYIVVETRATHGTIRLVGSGAFWNVDRFEAVESAVAGQRVPHKHAATIKAWAGGATIQCLGPHGWFLTECPQWHDEWTYRVKPESKPDVVGYMSAEMPTPYSAYEEAEKDNLLTWATQSQTKADNIKVVFDGETGRLKSVELIHMGDGE